MERIVVVTCCIAGGPRGAGVFVGLGHVDELGAIQS